MSDLTINSGLNILETYKSLKKEVRHNSQNQNLFQRVESFFQLVKEMPSMSVLTVNNWNKMKEKASHLHFLTSLQNDLEKLGGNTPEKFEFFRRICPDNWFGLKALLDGAVLTQDSLQAFKSSDWQSPVFQLENWAAVAIKAYISGEISQDVLCRLLIYDECQRLYGKENVERYQMSTTTGKWDQQAMEIVRISLNDFFLTADEIEVFLNSLGVSINEFHFFTIPFKLSRDLKEYDPNLSFEKTFAYNAVQVSRIYRINEGKRVVIFPPQIMEWIYEFKYEKNVMRPNRVLGYSKAADFRYAGKRDVFIPCRYITAPFSLHRLPSDSVTAYIHDAYFHLHIECENPHREIWIELASRLRGKGLKDDEEQILDRALYYAKFKCPMEALLTFLGHGTESNSFKSRQVIAKFILEIIEKHDISSNVPTSTAKFIISTSGVSFNEKMLLLGKTKIQYGTDWNVFLTNFPKKDLTDDQCQQVQELVQNYFSANLEAYKGFSALLKQSNYGWKIEEFHNPFDRSQN